jgi:hypothetical protein
LAVRLPVVSFKDFAHVLEIQLHERQTALKGHLMKNIAVFFVFEGRQVQLVVVVQELLHLFIVSRRKYEIDVFTIAAHLTINYTH